MLHLNDLQSAVIDVSGSISGWNVYSPKQLEMSATKDIYNTSLTTVHYKTTDKTTVTAGGLISYPSEYVFASTVGFAVPNMQLITQSKDAVIKDIALKIQYDAAHQELWFHGLISLTQLQALKDLGFVDATVLDQLWKQSQTATSSTTSGMFVYGPGHLHIEASSIDLGSIKGIVSYGIGENAALAVALDPLTKTGANIDILVHGEPSALSPTAGKLSMLTTKIESEFGGDITIHCGTLDVGRPDIGSSQDAQGILSLWGGNITIDSIRDINVNGSRIATYDGGDISVTSDKGNVDAGVGGAGWYSLTKPYIDPRTGELMTKGTYLGGSGILALSYPERIPGQPLPHMGDITVTTPEGDISASSGGIVQIPYGPVSTQKAKITLTAGTLGADGKTVIYVGNIRAGDSGVVGGDITLKASGSIDGLVVARENISIAARQNVNVTALAQGGVSIAAGGTVAGVVAGLGSVSVTGGDISASLSGNVATSGTLSGAAVAPTTVATGNAETAQSGKAAADSDAQTTGESEDDKKKKRPTISEYVGRVTVLLPKL